MKSRARRRETSKNPPKRSDKLALPKAEWDFRKVPEAELEACFLYEYGRELVGRDPKLSGLLSVWKTHSAAPKRSEGWHALAELCRILASLLHDFRPANPDTFPELSWQELPQEDRDGMVRSISEGLNHYWQRMPQTRLSISTLRELEAAKINSLLGFAFAHELICQEDCSGIEYGFFAINWNFPESEIKASFNKWLTEQAKNQDLVHKKKNRKVGRGGPKDLLNRLGCLRVREHYRTRDLTEYGNPQLIVSAPCKYRNDLFKNAREALEFITDLFARKEFKKKFDADGMYQRLRISRR